ncbi:hypothetical protein BGW80DRAFT_66589 [Lactifluus volemus]|nr:hypothetical protein BGW80DRAFT_66589 [Lactifluus volemus]
MITHTAPLSHSFIMSAEGGQNALPDAPFNDTRADCILRSSDGVDFRTFKIILSLASPIFADMLNNPGPQSVSEQDYDGLQVVTVSEDSKVLNLCLRHLYPLPFTTVLVKLQDASILADFASKYEVKTLESMVVRYLTDAIEDDPVGVYAIAVTSKRKDIAAKAAQSSLKLPFSCLRSPQPQCVTTEIYKELIVYHAACGDAASAVTSGRKWFPSWEQGRLIWYARSGLPTSGCSLCAAQDSVSGPPVEHKDTKGLRRFGPWCLWNYLHRSASVLARHPSAEAVITRDFVLKFCDCSECPSGTREDMLGFSQIFAAEIEKAVRQVQLPANCIDRRFSFY